MIAEATADWLLLFCCISSYLFCFVWFGATDDSCCLLFI
jgi:hypothetical protein